MLIKERVDIFPIEKDVGYEIINNNYTSDQRELFVHHPKPIIETSHHLIFTKRKEKSFYWVKQFNDGLKQLRKSGEYQKMFEASQQGEYSLEL